VGHAGHFNDPYALKLDRRRPQMLEQTDAAKQDGHQVDVDLVSNSALMHCCTMLALLTDTFLFWAMCFA
jgi:hypothetical protein